MITLEQALDLELTQDEVEKMDSLLNSGASPKIMLLMLKMFAAKDDENAKFLLSTITEIANAVIDRANATVCMKNKVIETVGFVAEPLKRYPHGPFGMLTYILSECNFKELYEKDPAFSSTRRLMTGSRLGRMMIPLFREFIDLGEAAWKDFVWTNLDICGYGDRCRELVRWCMENRDKWDDGDGV